MKAPSLMPPLPPRACGLYPHDLVTSNRPGAGELGRERAPGRPSDRVSAPEEEECIQEFIQS